MTGVDSLLGLLWETASRLTDGSDRERDSRLAVYGDSLRLEVVDEIRAAGSLDAYEVQVRQRMSRGKGTGR